MADGLLASSLEQAFVAVVSTAVGALAPVYGGKRSGDKALPCVICEAQDGIGDEDPPRSGNFWIEMAIGIKATAATEAGALVDPIVADLNLVQVVWQTLKVDNLDALLNATGQNLTVFPNGYFFGAPKSGFDQEGAWVDVIPIKVYCCPTILAP